MVEESTFRPKIKKPDEKISEIYTALKYFKQGEFESVISQINIPENIPFLISPAGDVIPSSRIFYAKWSSHEVSIQN